MSVAVTVRLPDQLFNTLESVGQDEHLEKSALIKKWLAEKAEEYLLKKAVDRHLAGHITIEQAAKQAKVSVWHVIEYMQAQRKAPITTMSLDEEIAAVEHLVK